MTEVKVGRQFLFSHGAMFCAAFTVVLLSLPITSLGFQQSPPLLVEHFVLEVAKQFRGLHVQLLASQDGWRSTIGKSLMESTFPLQEIDLSSTLGSRYISRGQDCNVELTEPDYRRHKVFLRFLGA